MKRRDGGRGAAPDPRPCRSPRAPRRTDPLTGEAHHSVIKPLGADHRAETLVFEEGVPRIGALHLTAADDAERDATVQVMGGAEWQMGIDALQAKGLLADVQAAVRAAWDRGDAERIASGADTGWFRDEVGRLYGWDVPGADYGAAAETTVPWPADVRPTTCTSAATARVNAASGGAA
ncbi:hypothetical protein [Streptomyces sp. 3211]|uniref:hypothetical protein n=1 Tax=Streptomyces sp. 3211 TaxID=1964449 RepID=UPI0009A55389|nr:hypothetical protein [Streptomyces sp. 3211]